MRDPELINSIYGLTNTIGDLVATINLVSNKWWNTQWFSALIGAIAALLGSWVVSVWRERNRKLSEYYQWFLDQRTFCSPDGVLHLARINSYSAVQSGDKPLGEKMVIAFRSHNKYWYKPVSIIRLLFARYEVALGKIKNGKGDEIKETPEYKEAEKRFKTAEKFIYKKTGETEWTS